MIGIVILLGTVLLSDEWALPHAGATLFQNELTYFRDCAIIVVEKGETITAKRQVTTPGAGFEVDVVLQKASVESANFEAGQEITLTFTPNLPHTQPARRPGWIDLPLKPGRYFVMGRASRDGSLFAYPGATGYGIRDESEDPPVPRAIFKSADSKEFAVFHVLATGEQRLSEKANRPRAVMNNLVGAALASDDAGFFATMGLLLRTRHLRFQRFLDVSANARKNLAAWQAPTESKRAMALLVAYRMGNFTVDVLLCSALARASIEDGERWIGYYISKHLRLTNPETYPSPEEQAYLKTLDRQLELLKAAEACATEPVYFYVLRNLSQEFYGEMEPSIIVNLRKVEPGDRSTKRLLFLMARWYDEPSKSPRLENSDEAELIQYWLKRLDG